MLGGHPVEERGKNVSEIVARLAGFGAVWKIAEKASLGRPVERDQLAEGIRAVEQLSSDGVIAGDSLQPVVVIAVNEKSEMLLRFSWRDARIGERICGSDKCVSKLVESTLRPRGAE